MEKLLPVSSRFYRFCHFFARSSILHMRILDFLVNYYCLGFEGLMVLHAVLASIFWPYMALLVINDFLRLDKECFKYMIFPQSLGQAIL